MGALTDLAHDRGAAVAGGDAQTPDEGPCPPSTEKSPAALRTLDFEAPVPAGWRGGLGASLEDEAVRARLVGPDGAPVVAALGGISADRFVTPDPNARTRGWWGGFVRPGGGIDLTRYRVLGIDFSPLACSAPLPITPSDQARLLALAMDAAGVDRLHALVGASYGGMVGLAFARLFPDRLDRLCVISAAHRPHPMATAWRGIQRRILQFGIDAGRPEEGVALARQLAMTTYRTPEELAERFRPGIPDAGDDAEVCGYLKARGEAYAAVASPARFATLSAAIDRHNEDPALIATPTLLVGADTDRLVPIEDMQELERSLAGPARLEIVSTPYGHDSFLKDMDLYAPHVRAWLDAPLPPRSQEEAPHAPA